MTSLPQRDTPRTDAESAELLRTMRPVRTSSFKIENDTLLTSRRHLHFPLGAVPEVDNPEIAENSSLQYVPEETNQALGESERRGSNTSEPTHTRSKCYAGKLHADGTQLSCDQHGLTNPVPSCPQEIEGTFRQASGHLQDGHRVRVCHILMATSIIEVATSLSLALWWSIAHGDPGSGFTIGSYVLAAFGVLVAIPAYPHSKVCKCWESRSKGA